MKKFYFLVIFISVLVSCMDMDRDGVYDKNDECPYDFGLEEFNGCPDTDEDGVPDYKDECPYDFGLEEFNGCPDTDEDGVPDYKDECPYDFGLEEFNGCLNNDHVPISVSECLRSYTFTKSEINRVFRKTGLSINSTINIGYCESIIEYLIEYRRLDEEKKKLDEEKKKIDAMDRELNEGLIFSSYRRDYGSFIVVQKGGRFGTYYLMEVLSGGMCSSGGTMKFNEFTYEPQKVWVRDEPFKVRATLFTMKLIDFSKNRNDLEQRFN